RVELAQPHIHRPAGNCSPISQPAQPASWAPSTAESSESEYRSSQGRRSLSASLRFDAREPVIHIDHLAQQHVEARVELRLNIREPRFNFRDAGIDLTKSGIDLTKSHIDLAESHIDTGVHVAQPRIVDQYPNQYNQHGGHR